MGTRITFRRFCRGNAAENYSRLRGWNKRQQDELNQMNLVHLDCLRLENRRVSFQKLTHPSPDHPYLEPLRLLNECAPGATPSASEITALEEDLLRGMEQSASRIRYRYKGKYRAIKLVLLIENLLYLIERADYYAPSERVFRRMMQIISPSVRLEARLSSSRAPQPLIAC